jgi:hypothetical protein
MIINFLNLPIGKLLEFNLVNKKFYFEIIPFLMLPMRKEVVSDWYKLDGIKFDSIERHRIVFMQNNNFYEIKELDDQISNDIKIDDTPFL